MQPTDPLSAVAHPDPYPYYRALARGRPLYRDDALGLWVACAPAVIRVLLDEPAARVRPVQEPVPPALQDGAAGALFGRFARMIDGPRHAALKPLLEALLAEPAPRPPAHWPPVPDSPASLDRFLFDAPVYAQAGRLGLPDAEAAPCARDVAQFRAALRAAAWPADIAAGHAAAARLRHRLLAHLRRQSAATPLAALRRRAAGTGIDDETLAANLAGLLFQSCEAGAGLIGNTLVALGRDPARAAAARADERLCLQAAADCARLDPPVHNTRRYLARPLILADTALPAAATVLLVLAAAAMAHAGAAPWTFGAGRHACPGRTPALQAAGLAVAHLLRAGLDVAALARAFRYLPLPNARIPQFGAPRSGYPGV
ncbi:cytochrome [Bordetella petrii]|uniref:cytochrome n=1 Tax=Bordetella petrii TaxID=94624 RepID=UPI00373163FD